MKKYFHCVAVIIITLLLIILSPIITYIITFYLSNQDIIPVIGTVDAWIGFAGSIIGGSITMIALFFTMKMEQCALQIQNDLSIKPYIYCEIINDITDIKEIALENCINNEDFIEWKMINATGNIADNIRIIEEKTFINNSEYEYIEQKNLLDLYGISIHTVLTEDFTFLPPQREQIRKTNFSIITNSDGTYKWCSNQIMFKHSIVFVFSDISNCNSYKSKFEYEININIDENDKLHFFLGNLSNSMIE